MDWLIDFFRNICLAIQSTLQYSHIQTPMAEAAMQGAGLLIRSNLGFLSLRQKELTS